MYTFYTLNVTNNCNNIWCNLRPHCGIVGFVMRVTDVYKSIKTHITLDINPNHSRRLIAIIIRV